MFLIRSGAIEGFEKLVSQLGQNPVEILRTAGFTSAQLREANSYVSYSKLATLLDSAAEVCNEPMFGLRLAAGQSLMVIGELAFSVSQQATLGQAMAYFDQHARLHARGVHLRSQIRGARAELAFSFDFSNASGLLHLIQMSVGQLLNSLGVMLESPAQQVTIHLQQARPSAELWQWSGSQSAPTFNSHFDGVSFPANWLERKLPNVQDSLQAYFQQRIQLLEERYPDNLQAQVRHLISHLLAYGECSVERVSAGLGLHPRVLQKRLLAAGVSYSQLLQETRLEIAQQHLQNSRLNITELALHLGYAEVAVFSRNFKRWTGQTPSQWRQRLAAQPAVLSEKRAR